jgi:hypothetical protein
MGGALTTLARVWDVDEYIDPKGTDRLREIKAAGGRRVGTWLELVSATFSPRLHIRGNPGHLRLSIVLW